MFWVIILALITWIFIQFFKDVNKQARHVQAGGGMRKKYEILVDYLLYMEPGGRIIDETNTNITIGYQGASGYIIFDIIQTFGTITIQYKAENIIYGKHKLEWIFNEYAPQNQMIEQIIKDVESYNIRIMQKF